MRTFPGHHLGALPRKTQLFTENTTYIMNTLRQGYAAQDLH